jgi:hypothetical protein
MARGPEPGTSIDDLCHPLVSQLKRNVLDLRRDEMGTFAYSVPG